VKIGPLHIKKHSRKRIITFCYDRTFMTFELDEDYDLILIWSNRRKTLEEGGTKVLVVPFSKLWKIS
jgi:hypothetical protein